MATQVNLGTNTLSDRSSVSYHAASNTIIVSWQGEELANQDIYIASFDVNGSVVTAQTNLTSAGSAVHIGNEVQVNPSIASNNFGDGRIALSYSSQGSDYIITTYNYDTLTGFTSASTTDRLTHTSGVPLNEQFSDAFFIRHSAAATTYSILQTHLNFSSSSNTYDPITNPEGWSSWEVAARIPSQSLPRIYVGDTVGVNSGIITVSAEGGRVTHQINVTYMSNDSSIVSNYRIYPTESTGSSPNWRNFSLPAMDAQDNGHTVVAWANTTTGDIQITTFDISDAGGVDQSSSIVKINNPTDSYLGLTNANIEFLTYTQHSPSSQDHENFQEGGVAVAIDPVSGNSLVVWTTDDGTGNRDITGRFVDIDGTKLGSTIEFGTPSGATPGDQWAPSVAALGNDKFAVTWSSDDNVPGTSDVYLQVVSISGIAINQAPVANGEGFTGTVSTKQYFPVADMLLANDTDANGDPLHLVSVQNAKNGTVTLSPDGEYVTLTPTAGFYGTASFEYIVSDGRGGTDSATVSLSIPTPPPPPPELGRYNPFTSGDDQFTMPGGTDRYPYFILDGLEGFDHIRFVNTGSSAENVTYVNNIESISGSDSSDRIMSEMRDGVTVDLGYGLDTYVVTGNNSIPSHTTAYNVEYFMADVGYTDTVTGINNVVYIADSGTVALGGGIDTLSLASSSGAGARIEVTASYIETISSHEVLQASGGFNEIISVATPLKNGDLINLLGGLDAVSLSNATNTGAIYNVETVKGGTDADIITARFNNGTGSVTYDLAAGNDTIIIAQTANGIFSTLTATNVESVTGSSSGDIVLINGTNTSRSVDLSGGDDRLAIIGDTTVTVSNVELITGVSTSVTNIHLHIGSLNLDPGQSSSGLVIDLGNSPSDSVTLGASAPTTGVSIYDVETISSGINGDTITVAIKENGYNPTLYIDTGSGSDSVDLDDAHVPTPGSPIQLTNVETFIGTAATDVISLPSQVLGGSVFNGIGGNDTLYFNDAGNAATVLNFETVTARSGNDHITAQIAGAPGTARFDLGGGSDTLSFTPHPSATQLVTVSAYNIETITGGTDSDVLVLAAVTANTSVDLGGTNDFDVLNLMVSATVTASNVESFVGTNQNDTVLLMTTPGKDASGTFYEINLGEGFDKIALPSSGPTASISLTNIESILGGVGDDLIFAGSADHAVSLDLGGGVDSFFVNNAYSSIHTYSLANIETFAGSTGSDTVYLTYQVDYNVSANLFNGLGNEPSSTPDTIYLANYNNFLKVRNVESVSGNNQSDKIIVTARDLTTVIPDRSFNFNGGSGIDTLQFEATYTESFTYDVEVVTGWTGDERITVNGSGSFAGAEVSGGLGNDTITASHGNDIFVFHIGDGQDRIEGFNNAEDDLSMYSSESSYATIQVVSEGTKVILSPNDFILLVGVTGITDISQLLHY